TDTTEAVQNVVDRVSSYQDGATEGTVAQELRDGLNEVGAELSEADVDKLVAAIEANAGDVRVGDVLA
ncbi:MAG: hypothetical protein JWO46_1592, partial [Nocardioidaceae bacterium]|nr:hypothetical protein [Nocardioidaceae bacterium]